MSETAAIETATTDPLLQPLKIKGLTIRNRIMSTSHACGLEEEGMPTEAYQRYHEEKAKGGIGLTMFGGSSNVAPDSPNVFRQLNVGTDLIIPHLQKFSERVHAQGAAIMVQITHLGRRGEPYAQDWLPTIAPSPIRETLHRSFPREMDEHDVKRIVDAFGAAAKRCEEGGLDGIETLAGGHLIGQFFSPVTNKRTDRFGGSLENRCRFGLMVYDAMRAAVSDKFLIGFRFVVDEAMAGGLSFEECVEIAHIFEAEGHIDFFNAVYGRMDTEVGLAVDNMPGMATPIGPWLDKAAAFKREVKAPVFHAARISDLATARYAIREGLLDMVGMTRAHIADPHLVAKLMRGEEDRVRPCVGMTYCQGVTRPTCIHNASTGRETRYPQKLEQTTGAKRRVVVVGGGPAGLEAARVSAERGHSVVLFEAASRLGGQIRMATAASWRGDVIGIVDWRAGEIEHLGVDVRLNNYAEPDDLRAENPDVVIIATGGVPDLDWLEGVEHCTSVWDALTNSVPETGEVIVYDGTGRHAAATAAERMARAGRPTGLVTLDGFVAAELAYAERTLWKKHLYELEVAVTPDHRLLAVEPSGNRLKAVFSNELTGSLSERIVDHVIVEHGTQPADELYHDLRSGSSNDGVTDIEALLAGTAQPANTNAGAPFELHRIGDAVTSRNLHSAIFDALRLCLTI
jgi:2,4-dienoyl-CoA reductase-like NADH-dependent reductase (Old Yellow Enzyme family)/thioredoxin reductase